MTEYGRIHTDGSRSGGQPIPSEMTNEERAALVERLRKYVFDDDDIDKAADQIEADGKRIAELEAEVLRLQVDSEPSPYCPICGSCGDEGCCGEKRCLYPDAASQERIVELEAALSWSLIQLGSETGYSMEGPIWQAYDRARNVLNGVKK